jgi:hypothetical protein
MLLLNLIFDKYVPQAATLELVTEWARLPPADSRFAYFITGVLEVHQSRDFSWLFDTITTAQLENMPLSEGLILSIKGDDEAAKARIAEIAPTDKFGKALSSTLLLNITDDADEKMALARTLLESANPHENDFEDYFTLLMLILVYQGDHIPAALRDTAYKSIRALRADISENHPLVARGIPMLDRSIASLKPNASR